MALLRTTTAAFALSLLGLPALAQGPGTDCSSYLEGDLLPVSVEIFDTCMEAGAWDLKNSYTRQQILIATAKSSPGMEALGQAMAHGMGDIDDALTAVIIAGRDDLIPTLVARGANPSHSPADGIVPLQAALLHAMNGELEVAKKLVKQLMEAGADPHVPGDAIGVGELPTMHLTVMQFPDDLDMSPVLELLVAGGGDINLGLDLGDGNPANGFTPLHFALVTEGSPAIVQKLLDLGADPLRYAANGKRPVDLDTMEGAEFDPAAMELVKAAAGKR